MVDIRLEDNYDSFKSISLVFTEEKTELRMGKKNNERKKEEKNNPQ